jgi:hypothetical protein
MRRTCDYFASILFLSTIAIADSGPIVAVAAGQIRRRALASGPVFKGMPFAAPSRRRTATETSDAGQAMVPVFPAGPVADSEKKISSDIETYWSNYARTAIPTGSVFRLAEIRYQGAPLPGVYRQRSGFKGKSARRVLLALDRVPEYETGQLTRHI